MSRAVISDAPAGDLPLDDFERPRAAGRRAIAWLARDAGRLVLAMRARPRESLGSVAVARPVSRQEFDRRVLVHLDAAYNFARFLCRDPDAAQDIVQDAVLRAFRAFSTFRGEDVRVWLLAIVRNCFRDWAAARRKLERAEIGIDFQEDPGEDAASPRDIAAPEETAEEALIRRQDAEAVRRVLLALPEALREVLVLREFDQLSYREIAEVAQIPIGTVMSRLARARATFAAEWRSLDGEGATL